ncbi:hypothetical protein NG895_14005 [Aeoliella sp. ICT_H6.2]|uniref:Uncharacterized protein n=1 Tax=Aeoliella straminimaris TaxID=2954799 RepID=A0A9X2FEX1_9BACT|nr:hypothetical protein [Aeoliella straminimaris]MCO6045019.1 hypothetical protein [Aeoliella straminimaris]
MNPRYCCGILFCLLAQHAAPCHAGLSIWHDWSWSTTSQNDKYVFVCLLTDPVDKQIAEIRKYGDSPPEIIYANEIAEVQRLYDTYPCTGMYRNDGSTTPLWTTNGWIHHGVPSPDGRLLVYFNTDNFFHIDVHDGSSPGRSLSDLEMIGWVPFGLNLISDESGLQMEDFQLDANWMHVKVIWDNGSTTTVRLDDFAIVQSNTLGYALYHLITTVRGIVLILVVSFLTTMFGYLLTNWVMRRRTRRERS